MKQRVRSDKLTAILQTEAQTRMEQMTLTWVVLAINQTFYRKE